MYNKHRQTVGQTSRIPDPLIVSHSRKCGVVPADKRADEVGWHFDPRCNTSFDVCFLVLISALRVSLTYASWFVAGLCRTRLKGWNRQVIPYAKI